MRSDERKTVPIAERKGSGYGLEGNCIVICVRKSSILVDGRRGETEFYGDLQGSDP